VHILFPQVSYTQKNTSFSITLTLLFPNRHGFHIQSCSNRNCPRDGKLYTLFAYTSLFLPINIRKKNCTFISMGNATQKSCKKTNKTTSDITKSLKYVKACCSDRELGADQRKRQTWFTTLLRERERERETVIFFYTCVPTSFQSLIV